MTNADRLGRYLGCFQSVLAATEAADRSGRTLTQAEAVDWAIAAARAGHDRGNTVMFIGNGGSAAIASHMANDFQKNGGMRALAFNDGATLTCLGNDFGYPHVFEKQIEMHARPGDLLVAISSSGRSPNILKGVAAARAAGAAVLTLSGFDADNPLRTLGDVNLYVPSSHYGFVEAGHLTLLSAVLDISMGWNG